MKYKDSSQSWIVAVCTTALIMLETMIIKSLGVLLADIREDFLTHTWVIGLSIALTPGFSSIACLVTGGMSKHWSPRNIICMCAVLSSLGLLIASYTDNVLVFMASFFLTGFVGGSVTISVGILSSYFDKYYSHAVSMATCGGSLGIILSPPLTQFLLDLYGWRGAVRIIAGMCLQSLICGALIKPMKSDYAPLNSKQVVTQKKTENLLVSITRKLDISLFYKLTFVCMICIGIGSGYYTTGWMIYAVPYAMDIGFGPYEATGVATAGGIGNLIGNFLHPLVGKCMSNRAQLYASQCGVTLTLFFSVLASTLYSYTWMILCSILYGVCRGLLAVVWYAILNEVIEENQMVNAIGWTWTVYGVGAIASGFVSGWLYDQLQSFTLSFLMLGLVNFLSMIPIFVQDLCLIKDR